MLLAGEDFEDAVGILHGPSAQGDCVIDGEEAGVESNGGAEREQSDGGEAGLAAQAAQGVADILKNAFEPWPDPDGARVFPGECEVADGFAGKGAVEIELFGELGVALAGG